MSSQKGTAESEAKSSWRLRTEWQAAKQPHARTARRWLLFAVLVATTLAFACDVLYPLRRTAPAGSVGEVRDSFVFLFAAAHSDSSPAHDAAVTLEYAAAPHAQRELQAQSEVTVQYGWCKVVIGAGTSRSDAALAAALARSQMDSDLALSDDGSNAAASSHTMRCSGPRRLLAEAATTRLRTLELNSSLRSSRVNLTDVEPVLNEMQLVGSGARGVKGQREGTVDTSVSAESALADTVAATQGAAEPTAVGHPVILEVEPSGAIGYGATFSSLLIVGVFNVQMSDIEVDGVRVDPRDIIDESSYVIRLSYIPASPTVSTNALLWFNGAATLGPNVSQDCDAVMSRPVTITLIYSYASTEVGGTRAEHSVDITLDGREGRPLLVRFCSFTPLLLSLSSTVRVMERWAARVGNTDAAAQRLTLVLHPQYGRVAGQPQQDWEAGVRRFSAHVSPFTFSDVEAATGLAKDAIVAALPSREWWMAHTTQALTRVASKDAMYGNVSLLWSVGEVTGDLLTATVLCSLDVAQELYGLHLVLPSLTKVAHTVTLPAVHDLYPGSGIRVWNQNWMVVTTYYDLNIRGAFPRSTLVVNDDTRVALRTLRFPALSDGDPYASVYFLAENCQVRGDGSGDTIACQVAVDNENYDAAYDDYLSAFDLMATCGGGVVVDLYVATQTTAEAAAAAVVNGSSAASARLTLEEGFPLSLAANSMLRLISVLEASPSAYSSLRRQAANAAASYASASSPASSADDVDSNGRASALVGNFVTLRYSFVYQSQRSGTYRMHCDGSAADVQVSIAAADDPARPVYAHCISAPGTTASVFRHAAIETVFDAPNALYVNVSCAFPLSTLLDPDETAAAFCGVALEGWDLDWGVYEASATLPAYAVYELRLPMLPGPVNYTAASYTAALTSSNASAPIAVLELPALTTAAECYALPWRIAESAAAHPTGSLYGQRWGGLGYAQHTFTVTAQDGTRHCHTFVAFALPSAAAASCDTLELSVQSADSDNGSTIDVQSVFCGSRSYFMDPISALQLRVPLVEVPRLVDLDALIPDTETGYVVYQYCVDVVFDLAELRSSTGAYAINGPLVYTILDTAKTESDFVPWVRQTVPDASTALVLGDTLYLTGESLRYYDSTGTRPLTGTQFLVRLADAVVEACGDFFLVSPSRAYPVLSAQWLNESTIALPITADVPGGWFNFTVTQGEAGEAYVSCGLSLRVMGAVTSVTTSDVAGTAGGTVVTIRGVNLPVATGASRVMVTLGSPNGEAGVELFSCAISFSAATLLMCVTPPVSAEKLARRALSVEETSYATLYSLPVNVTSLFYNGTSDAWQTHQSINVDTVDDGAALLSVTFRVGKMVVDSVTPTVVSPMAANPTFQINGTNMESHTVLLCDASTVTSLGTLETTTCILCLPRSFSATSMTCDALSRLTALEYKVYVSDTPLSGDTGFIVTTRPLAPTVSPAFLYPYAEGVLLTITAMGFERVTTTDLTIVARSSGSSTVRQYSVPFESFNETHITARAPDLGWMADDGGLIVLNIFYGTDGVDASNACTSCSIRVVAADMMPRIHSIDPYAGQAPLLINVYGSGFTKLAHSPQRPFSLTPAASAKSTAEWLAEETTYITIGADPCRIVSMLNTHIVCNLTAPCASAVLNSVVRLVSDTYGSTAVASAPSNLFFFCVLILYSVSHTTGSVAGGQAITLAGVGFPSNTSQLAVFVAGQPCTVTSATRTTIDCITTASGTGRTVAGAVVVRTLSNGRESSCCYYTYDPAITPTVVSLSPSKAAAGARLLLFGTNFPYGTGEAMTVLFGHQRLSVTEVQSSTRAAVTIPGTFFGRDYLTIHVTNVGNSPRNESLLVTVLMTPSMTIPSSGGFRGQLPIRLVGTDVGANRPASEVAALFDVFVCGRPCVMADANDDGEVVCRTPTYMDEATVARYRAFLAFPRITDGLAVHTRLSADTTSSAVVVKTAAAEESGAWSDVSAVFGVASINESSTALSGAATILIASSDLRIVLQARRHSRLLLYNLTLGLTPVAASLDQLDLTNATCRVHLSTAAAETQDIMFDDPDPRNTSAWRPYDSEESSAFGWPALQVGTNSLSFSGLGTLPSAAYVLINCNGLPKNALELRDVVVNGYQVGLDAAGGRCPVNLRAAHRSDQPTMDSCASRDGDACPIFSFLTALTPVVTRYDPAYALANDVGALITLHGSGFGDRVGDVSTVLLDKALCLPVSVTDTALVCAMQGRVSRDADWQVLWTDESGRGEAMLLSAQPFYAAVTWSSYLAWKGDGLPREGQIVVIPAGTTILLDITPPALTGMVLSGVLIIADEVDVELRLGMLAIADTGALIAGSATNPHRHRFTITLTTNMFQDSPLQYVDDILTLSRQTEPYLHKLLEVLGGTLQLHGVPPTVAAAYLARSASPGDTAVTVDRWVPWAIGDTVALVTKSDHNPHHVERRAIVDKVANATHTVLYFLEDAPLQYLHIGADRTQLPDLGARSGAAGWAEGWTADTFAEAMGTQVVYLTRTIRIRGDETSTISAVGGALWLHDTTTSQLSHVELSRMGKRGSSQSYGVWLRGISYPADWVLLDDVVVHDAYFRGVVLEETRHVVLNQVTVLYADGFGFATVRASDQHLSLHGSTVMAVYGHSGGIDTVAAGLFVSSAEVAVRSSEVCVCDGHGVWFALRFLFVSDTARMCPGQHGLAAFTGNRIHHVGGHGVIIHPLQYNVDGRCSLSENSAAANDPANASRAAMLAADADSSPMLFAGTLDHIVVFSCGRFGIYLPPSSGYVVRNTVIMDCAAVSLFADYTTNTTVVRDSFFSATLPDGTCSRAEGSEYGTSEQYCTGQARRVGLLAHHGGHLSLASLALGNFTTGTAMHLATLSVPSSQATTYSSGSYGALRSAHLTARFFNLTAASVDAETRVVFAGDVAVMDTDGQLTQTNVSSFLFFGGANYSSLPSFCFASQATVGSSDSGSSSGSPSVAPAAAAVTVAPRLAGVSELLDSALDAASRRTLPFAWSRGVEASVQGGHGKQVVKLVAAPLNNWTDNGDSNSLASDRDTEDPPLPPDGMHDSHAGELVACVAPSKQLSLLFVRVAAGGSASEESNGERCTAVTGELRGSADVPFVLHAALSDPPSADAATPTAPSAVSFYTLTNDDDLAAGGGLVSAYAKWNEAVATTEDAYGRAGFYSLASSVNLTLAFRTASGAVCYPSEFSINADPSLPWPTSSLVVRVRVAPSASHFEPLPSTHSSCTQSPVLAGLTWTNEPISDATRIDTAGASSSHAAEGESAALSSSLSLEPSYVTGTSTVVMSMAQNTACLRARSGNVSAAKAGGGAVASLGNSPLTRSSGPWDSSLSLWAATRLTACQREDKQSGIGCIGPQFPYLRDWVPTATADRTSTSTSDRAAYVPWESATAWLDGVAPWNVDLSGASGQAFADAAEEDAPAWYRDAYIIPHGVRVNLTLTTATAVRGVLLVVGELYITTASSAAASSAAEKVSSSPIDLNVTSLIVLGKLNVSVRDAAATPVRIVLGTGSNIHDTPYRLDAATLVYPGTLYAAGEVDLRGASGAPTVWKSDAMVTAGSRALPSLASMADTQSLDEWCTTQARFAVAAAVVAGNQTGRLPEINNLNVAYTVLHARRQCLTATDAFLPDWMRWQSSAESERSLTDELVGWLQGERIGLTSGTSSLYDAEESTITQSINASRVGAHYAQMDLTERVSVSTAVSDGAAVASRWASPHGHAHAHDETTRLRGYGIGTEAVKLSKTVVLDCAVARSSAGRGCMVLITKQRHPEHLFPEPRFRGVGISVRHFGKGGQMRAAATAVKGVEPLSFLPAVYVNISTDAASGVANASSRDGYAALTGSVVEASYGTALYTDRRNTRLFLFDSAVWYSEGGGIRLDGGGTGIFVSGVVVAGTRYFRSGSVDEDTAVASSAANAPTATALTTDDADVASLCSVLLNHSHVHLPIEPDLAVLFRSEYLEPLQDISSAASVQNVVAGGSESEGFCLPWDGTGGPFFIGNNTAHSSYVGLFLFNLSTASYTRPFVPCFSWWWQTVASAAQFVEESPSTSIIGTITVRNSITTESGQSVTANALGVVATISNTMTNFGSWLVHTNRFLGVYSSSHQNVSLTNSDIFGSPIGVALAVSPHVEAGRSVVKSSYIATFPRCSCTADMYNFSSFDADPVGFWQVCQPTALHQPAWGSRGCGGVAFVDDTYHYTAVLALPSYAAVPLSYNRSTVFTAPSGDALEASTEGFLRLTAVTFGAVGELNLCGSDYCNTTAATTTTTRTAPTLRSAAIVGAIGAGLRSSASLSAIVTDSLQYARSCAVPLQSSTTVVMLNSNVTAATEISTVVAASSDSSAAGTMTAATLTTTAVSTNAYRPLSGTAEAVVRLRPSTDAALSPAAAAVVASGQSSFMARCTLGSHCATAAGLQQAALREAYASPYTATVVYDTDGTLYRAKGAEGQQHVYVPRAASAQSEAAQLLAAVCSVAAVSGGQLLECPHDLLFYQLRLRSRDDRVRSDGAALPLLFTQTVVRVMSTVVEELNESANGKTTTVSPLQPPEAGEEEAAVLLSDAMLNSSAAQMAVRLPGGISIVRFDRRSYPENLELSIGGCSAISEEAQLTTVVSLPLLVEGMTVKVWSVETQTALESLTLSGSASAVLAKAFSSFAETGESQTAYLSSMLGGVLLSPKAKALWLRLVHEDPTTSVTGEVIILQFLCGAKVRIHQMVYATLILYTTDSTDGIIQKLLRDGLVIPLEELLPAAQFPHVNVSFYAEHVRALLFTTEPDAITGESMTVTIRLEAKDSFDYNITAAMQYVTELSRVFSPFYNYDEEAESCTAAAGADGGTACSILTIANVSFDLLMVIPPLLPSERSQMQDSLNKVSIVGRGSVAKGSLVAYTVVIPAVLFLMMCFILLRWLLPKLGERRAASDSAQPRAPSSLDLTAALMGPASRSAKVPTASVVTVWVAGLLRTSLAATLDKAGVTRSAEETVAALRDSSTETRLGTKESAGKGRRVSSSGSSSSGSADSAKVTRQLFLLPSYNVLSGASTATARPEQAEAALALQSRRNERIARVTNPRCSHDADQRRYVQTWRIAPRLLEHLVRRGSAGSGGAAAMLLPRPVASPSSPPAPLGGSFAGSSLRPQPPHTRVPGQHLRESSATPPLRQASSDGAQAARLSGTDSAATPPSASMETARAIPVTPQRVIAVSLAPAPVVVARDGLPLAAPPAMAAAGGATLRSSLSAYTPSVGRLPPVLTAATEAMSGGAEASPAVGEQQQRRSASGTGGGDGLAVAHVPGQMPVALQSILTTSILAGVPLAYPPTALPAASSPTLASRSSEVVTVEVARSRPTSGAAAGASADDATMVLRGRGSIMFTTPDADVEAVRARRTVVNVAMKSSDRFQYHDGHSDFDEDL